MCVARPLSAKRTYFSPHPANLRQMKLLQAFTGQLGEITSCQVLWQRDSPPSSLRSFPHRHALAELIGEVQQDRQVRERFLHACFIYKSRDALAVRRQGVVDG